MTPLWIIWNNKEHRQETATTYSSSADATAAIARVKKSNDRMGAPKDSLTVRQVES